MATPTNPVRSGASQQGHKQGRTPSGLPAATPPVSTPFSASHAHAAFSPRGPKSSPQQLKKSPANSTTLMGHHGTAPLNFDSPSAAAAMGALGLSNGLDMGLEGVGVGGIGGLAGLEREDDRIRRLDAILKILGKAQGRVSEAGLERLSQRTGLNKMWEDHRTPDGRTTKTFVMAGHGLQLDINIDNNIVQSVTLAFPESESAPIVTKYAERAGQILFNDLRLSPGQSPLTKTLDGFAANLGRLATLDKLSTFPGLDCQEAVTGVYESLERLYNWELSKAREDSTADNKSEHMIETAVLCSKSGRPAMHVRDQVGLTIDYWTERRLVSPTTSDQTDDSGRSSGAEGQTWSILVGCKALEGELQHAVRVSRDWISPKIEKSEPGPADILEASNGPALDWLEPEPTILPSSADSKEGGVDVVQPDGSTQRVPNVKFVATLIPPIVVPQTVSNSLFEVTSGQPPPMLLPPSTFDGIFFPIPKGTHHDASELRTISCVRDVPVLAEDGKMTRRRHENSLFVYKPVYGQTITELPFSHPRQLIAMLPTLRQYALISTLLTRSFGSNLVGDEATGSSEPIFTRSTVTTEEEYQNFMMERAARESFTTEDEPLSLDVVLSVHPSASLHVVFPFRDATANIELQIQPNGVIHIVSQNVIPRETGTVKEAEEQQDEQKHKNMKPQDLGRVLEVFEDLCQWAEWIRANLA